MLIGRLNIQASRWPWQTRNSTAALAGPGEEAGTKYGWKPTDGMGRFGGGWNWALGFQASSHSIMFKLLFGTVSVHYETDQYREWQKQRALERETRKIAEENRQTLAKWNRENFQ